MESDRKAMDELSFYTLAHRDPSFIHQYVVDAYAAQCADEHSKPIKIAFALAGLYLHIEKKCSGKDVQRAHMRMAKKRKSWPTFVLPDRRGDITAADVLAVPPGPERDAMIDAWCVSVWDAYRDVHGQVAELVRTTVP